MRFVLPRQNRARTAFTLIEVIVTIGIVALLATLVIVALGGVRAAANRAESVNALAQIGLAYSSYSSDHRQELMPGFMTGPRLKAFGINPRLRNGQPVDPALAPTSTGNPSTVSDASAYVWRLAPYLDGNWETMTIDYRNRELQAKISGEIAGETSGAGGRPPVYGPDTATGADLGLSRIPSFGLNSIFVGGDDFHGGSAVVNRNPWDNPGEKLAAVRFSEVKNPARLIVFAPVVSWGEQDDAPGNDLFQNPPISDILFGSPELRPPMLSWSTGTGVKTPLEVQWEVGTGTRILPVGNFQRGGGYPIARWGDELPTGRLDGSVTTETLLDLSKDLRLWSPFETGL